MKKRICLAFGITLAVGAILILATTSVYGLDTTIRGKASQFAANEGGARSRSNDYLYYITDTALREYAIEICANYNDEQEKSLCMNIITNQPDTRYAFYQPSQPGVPNNDWLEFVDRNSGACDKIKSQEPWLDADRCYQMTYAAANYWAGHAFNPFMVVYVDSERRLRGNVYENWVGGNNYCGAPERVGEQTSSQALIYDVGFDIYVIDCAGTPLLTDAGYNVCVAIRFAGAGSINVPIFGGLLTDISNGIAKNIFPVEHELVPQACGEDRKAALLLAEDLFAELFPDDDNKFIYLGDFQTCKRRAPVALRGAICPAGDFLSEVVDLALNFLAGMLRWNYLIMPAPGEDPNPRLYNQCPTNLGISIDDPNCRSGTTNGGP